MDTNTAEVVPVQGQYIDRETGDVKALLQDSCALLEHGWEIKREIDALESELKEINRRFVEGFGSGTSLVIPGVCRVSIAERESVKITNDKKLREVLGDQRFDDLVNTKVSYSPTEKLIEMSCDVDNPLAKQVRKYLTTGRSETVTWRAEK